MNKLQAFKKHKQNPQVESFRMLWDMQEKLPQVVRDVVKSIEGEMNDRLLKLVDSETKKLFDELPDLVKKKLVEIVNEVKQGKEGYTPIRGKDYFNAEDEKILTDFIFANIPAPIVPKNGKDADEKAIENRVLARIPKSKDGKDGSPDTPKQVQEKMLSLPNPWMPKEAIIGLEEMFMSLQKNAQQKGGGGGGSAIQYYDLTSQCNGVLRVFTIPKTRRVLGIFGTQFPISYRPVVDWTNTETTLTLTSEVSPPETGQTLYILYIPISSI